jgi:hypothetical protein
MLHLLSEVASRSMAGPQVSSWRCWKESCSSLAFLSKKTQRDEGPILYLSKRWVGCDREMLHLLSEVASRSMAGPQVSSCRCWKESCSSLAFLSKKNTEGWGTNSICAEETICQTDEFNVTERCFTFCQKLPPDLWLVRRSAAVGVGNGAVLLWHEGPAQIKTVQALDNLCN